MIREAFSIERDWDRLLAKVRDVIHQTRSLIALGEALEPYGCCEANLPQHRQTLADFEELERWLVGVAEREPNDPI